MTIDYTVTRRKITLAVTRDSTTGWRVPIDWTDTEEIEMIVTPRGEAGFYTPAGWYGQITDLGQCADPVEEFEHVVDGDNRWEVKFVHPIKDGDNFIRRDCALVRLPLYEASPGVATWTKTRPKDARERMLDYINGYVDKEAYHADGPYITKDDDSTQASWATIWEEPPYPLGLEFRAPSSPVQGLYSIGQADSRGLISASTGAPYAYNEKPPIHILCIDSEDCTGTHLQHKMEAELRYALENHPSGSIVNLDTRRCANIQLGSLIVYHTIVTVNYERDTTT